MENKMISVGIVLKPHGIRGELKVSPLTDHPQKRFSEDSILFLEDKAGNLKEVCIEKCKPANKELILKVNDINTMDEAENFRNCYFKIFMKDLIPPGPGEYYLFQIIGLAVYEENGEYLGKLIDVQQTGSNDVYIIKKDSKEILIPALKDVVKKIDLNTKTMLVRCMPGLR